MHFRTGKYDAHDGQKKPMHQITIRIGNTNEAELKSLFGEDLRVILERSSHQSLLLSRYSPGERGHHISIVKGTDEYGLTITDTSYPWLQLIAPAWALSDCAYKQTENGIEFFFPEIRKPPIKFNRGRKDEPLVQVVPMVRPSEATGSVLVELADKTLVARNIPLSKIEGVMRFLGGDWE